MRDKKFFDRVRKAILLGLTDGSAETLDEYLESAKQTHENTVYYATDVALQAQYVSMFESQGIEVAVLEHAVDTQFITMAEQLGESVKFVRVDADLADALKGDGEISESDELREIFSEVLDEGVELRFDALKDASVPALLNISEEARRVGDMMRMYGMGDGAGMRGSTLVLNTASPLIGKLCDRATADREGAKQMASYLYKLSLLTQKKLSADEMRSFMSDSVDILMKL
jgi:molecular chaperone HtpG